MINVLYIEKGLGKGGSALSLKYLVACLDKSSYRPFLLFTDRHAEPEAIRWEGVETFRIAERPPWENRFLKRPPIAYLFRLADIALRYLPQAVRITRFIRKKKVHVVHLNNDIDSQIAGVLAAKFTRTQFVCHLRSTRKLTKTEKVIARLIDHFVVLSEDGKVFYAGEGIPERKLAVSYDPYLIQDNSFHSDGVPEWARSKNGCMRVGICSRISPGKGHDVFLDAAGEVVRIVPDVRFFVIGTEARDCPGYERTLKDRAERLGLLDRVAFTGWEPNMRAAIGALDVLVDASSLCEGIRRTLVEAMIEGKPVVATDVGQTAWLLEKSGSGFLTPPNAPEELARRIIRLLGDKLLRQEMGKKGRDFALAHFDARKKAKEMEALYERVLDGQRSKVKP